MPGTFSQRGFTEVLLFFEVLTVKPPLGQKTNVGGRFFAL